jgi:hypothetical protein
MSGRVTASAAPLLQGKRSRIEITENKGGSMPRTTVELRKAYANRGACRGCRVENHNLEVLGLLGANHRAGPKQQTRFIQE